MSTLSSFDLNRLGSEIAQGTKTTEGTMLSAHKAEAPFEHHQPDFNPFPEVPYMNLFGSSLPAFTLQYGIAFPSPYRNIPSRSRSVDVGGTIAPHQMHIQHPQDMSRRVGAEYEESIGGSSRESSESLSLDSEKDISESGPSYTSEDGSEVQDDERGPTAGPSFHAADILETPADSTESEAEEPPAKRPRRANAELQQDVTTITATVCGLNGCSWPVTASGAKNREHVRTVHYKLGSGYKARSAKNRLHCLHGDCTSDYAYMDNLTKHIESAHWRRQFTCEGCNEVYSQRGSLTRHKKQTSCGVVKESRRSRRGGK